MKLQFTMCGHIVNIEELIQWFMGLYYHISVIVVQSINQRYEPPQIITSLETQLRHISKNYCLKVFGDCHVISAASIRLTQFFKREFSYIFSIFLTFYHPSLGYFHHFELAETIVCQLIPYVLNLLFRIIVAVWVVVAIHTH